LAAAARVKFLNVSEGTQGKGMQKEQAALSKGWSTALAVAALAFSIFLLPIRVQAQPFELIKTFTSPTPHDEGSAFGASVALHGTLALIGAPYAEDEAGHAYLFDVRSGEHLGTLKNPSPGPKRVFEGPIPTGDEFSLAVALTEDYALVSAPGENAGARHSGVVYVYDVTSLNLIRTIMNPTPNKGELFGFKLSAQGNHVAITPIFEKIQERPWRCCLCI
jgi:hypothetical protein